MLCWFFFCQAEDGIRGAQESRGLGDVYKRQFACYEVVERLRAAAAASDYQVVKLMEAAKGPAASARSDERQTGAAPDRPKERGA